MEEKQKQELKKYERDVTKRCSDLLFLSFANDSGFISSGILNKPKPHLQAYNTIGFALTHLNPKGDGFVYHWIELTKEEAKYIIEVLKHSLKK